MKWSDDKSYTSNRELWDNSLYLPGIQFCWACGYFNKLGYCEFLSTGGYKYKTRSKAVGCKYFKPKGVKYEVNSN